jgi:hypothetical protein
MDPFVGKYFSIEQIRKNVLRQTEEEFKEIDKQIKKEMADGKIVDPNAMMDPALAGQDPNAAMDPNAMAPEETGPPQMGDQGVEADPKDLKKAEF